MHTSKEIEENPMVSTTVRIPQLWPKTDGCAAPETVERLALGLGIDGWRYVKSVRKMTAQAIHGLTSGRAGHVLVLPRDLFRCMTDNLPNHAGVYSQFDDAGSQAM